MLFVAVVTRKFGLTKTKVACERSANRTQNINLETTPKTQNRKHDLIAVTATIFVRKQRPKGSQYIAVLMLCYMLFVTWRF